MARNMYGATSADFTLTSGGRVVPGAELTLWTARTGGTQITDLLDVDSAACTTVTSGADGSVVYYGPDADADTHWADSGQGARIAIRPVNITGETGATPALTIGTVTTGTAAATLTGTDEDPVLNLTLPSAGTDGVNTAAIQDDAVTAAKIAANAVGSSELADNAVDTAAIADGAVTAAKLATTGRFLFPTGAANGYGFTGGAVHLEGTSAPEGAVTANPGSTFLQTSGAATVTGMLSWRKATGTGNTGWVAEGALADTGWRDVTANVTSAGTTKYPNLKLAVRRRGDFLEYIAYTGTGTTDGAASTTVYDAPIGFRFSVLFTYRSAVGSTIQGANGQSAAPVAIYTGGTSIVIAQPVTAGIGNQVSGYLSGNATPGAGGAWPTSLPGSAV